ncbi:hypothetical protein ACH4T9_25680 [Micromonospora sp. NPDC020750]|uniref:hypothetical protein n=1 Tax=unclassified Micromonospora TaxID=2617518 RepID=UPI003798482A
MLETFDEFTTGLTMIGADGVDALNGFSLIVELPAAHDLQLPDALKRVVGARLYRAVAEVLEASELYEVDTLRLDWSDGNIGVVYKEPSFGFRIAIHRDLRITLSRSGSSLRLFHNWYRLLMPYLQGLVSRIAIDLTEVLDSDFDLQPLRAGYRFSLIVYDFIPVRAQKPVSSHELIGPLLARRPDEDGRFRPVLAGRDAASSLRTGRLDLKISNFREAAPGVHLREIYDIQAPGNQGYRGIWLDFHCIAETIDGDDSEPGSRLAPRPDFLLENYEVPYRDFFRDRVVKGFMADFFKDWNFSCAVGAMP